MLKKKKVAEIPDFFYILVHPKAWQLGSISALLSLDQLRSVKGRRQGAFICMQALSHREWISLRHGESCGLHEAGLTVPCCEPYPGKTILFMSDWLYTAGVEKKIQRRG